ncbi:MAG: hypothetical protein EA392_07470 [Cryomorphaceae bacterium]|nr:MAG: hypothetical protein EA392_07470 [Cryomorphaceae bacterium]
MQNFPKLVSRAFLHVLLVVGVMPVLLHGGGFGQQNNVDERTTPCTDFGDLPMAMLGFIEADVDPESQEMITEYKVTDAVNIMKLAPGRSCADNSVPRLLPTHTLLFTRPPR